jgi:predicted small secreted protein
MARGKNTKGMVILLFLVSALADAAPTMNGLGRDIIMGALSADSDSRAYYSPGITQITGLYNPRLAAIAAEFNKPPVSFTGAPPPDNTIKSLPGVPGTLLMVFVGFLCVSLVKDRRVWLATFAGLIWAGQAGFTALPQLASQLTGKRQSEQQYSPDVALLCEPEHPCRLRSDIEGTSYISLLHHLAGIPGAAASLLPRIDVQDKLQREYKKMTSQFCCRTEYTNISAKGICRTKTFDLLFEGNLHPINHY